MRRLEYSQLGENCYFEQLENGLGIFVVSKPGYAKTMAMLAVSYGGMDAVFSQGRERRETPEGIAHYLEHKMFDMREGNALTLLSSAGASVNAFTAKDITAYHFTCTSRFEENLRVLLRFVTTPYFTPESVEKERGIIAQEIRMYRDNPGHRVYENLLGNLYAVHPLRRSILGTEASIGQITDETLLHCHQAFYRMDNMVLVVVGDTDPRLVRDTALLFTGREESAGAVRDFGADEPAEAPRRSIREEMDVPEPTFLLGCKAEPFPLGEEGFCRRLLAAVAAELLCGEGSELYDRLYRDGLIHSDFSAACIDYPGAAFLALGGDSPDPDAVAEAVLQEAARISAQGVDEARFRRVLRSAYGESVRSLNSFETICSEMVRGWFSGYNYYDFPRLYATLTAQKAAAFLAETVQAGRSCLSVVVPKGGSL